MRHLQIFFLLIVVISPLSAQIDSSVVTLPEVTIKENRLEVPFAESSRNISYIGKRQLRNLPVQSAAEALSYVPGVDMRQRGPAGIQDDISIRGGTYEQTLVLINGIKLIDPQTGHYSMNLPVDFESIDHIVVLKGPGSRIYGQNAFSGAVNIITRVPEKKAVDLHLYGGDFGTYGMGASVALPAKKYGQYISFSHDASNGYHYNTDYKVDNVFYQSELTALGGKFNFLGGYTERRYGANGFYSSAAFKDQWESLKTGLASIEYVKDAGVFEIKPRFSYRHNDDKYVFVRQNPSVYENFHQTDALEADLNVSAKNRLGTCGMGLEYRSEMISGTAIRSGKSSVSPLSGHNLDNFGVYAEQKFIFGHFDVTKGVYANWYNQFGWNIFPGIDLGYDFGRNIRVYANAGRSVRIPTFTDLYYDNPGKEEGNPSLKPEDALTYEGGIRYSLTGFTFNASYFYQHATRLIDWVTVRNTDSTTIVRAVNLSNVDKSGVELTVHMLPSVIFSKNFPVKDLTLSYNYIKAGFNHPEFIESRYALQNIRHQLIMGIEHTLFAGFTHNFKVRYIDRVNMAPYWVLDSRFTWNVRNFKVYAEASNLTATHYTEVMTVMPGRWFRMGMQMNIPF